MIKNNLQVQKEIMGQALESQPAEPELGFLEYLAEGVLILDQDCRIKAVNQALVRMLGWSAQELIGQNCYEVRGGRHPVAGTAVCEIENLCRVLPFPGIIPTNLPNPSGELPLLTKAGARREV